MPVICLWVCPDGFTLQVLEKVLSELERVCIAEQDFCFRFFHLIDKTVQANPELAVKVGPILQ